MELRPIAMGGSSCADGYFNSWGVMLKSWLARIEPGMFTNYIDYLGFKFISNFGLGLLDLKDFLDSYMQELCSGITSSARGTSWNSRSSIGVT